jgi:transcriptional regulator with XRE-family HTH domain
MVTPALWQNILQQMIKTPGEHERLAEAIGLSQMTITRWAKGSSNPQRPHLTRLVQVVQPQYREDLIEALEITYPDIQSWLKDEVSEQIPADFFAQILSIRTTTTDALRFWRISDLILKHALTQLDPHQYGMSITLAQCMPPSPHHNNKIVSLRERVGKGTYPWSADLEHLALFLGMESLGGYATEMRHIVNVDDLSKDKLLPAYQTEHEISAAAHPIMLGGLVAGCLSASSTQVGYFTQARQALLIALSDLASLAFEKEDFYPPEMIELRVMPRPEFQRPILAKFRHKVSKTLTQAAQQRLLMSNREAEQRVWQEIEEELFSLPDNAYEH